MQSSAAIDESHPAQCHLFGEVISKESVVGTASLASALSSLFWYHLETFNCLRNTKCFGAQIILRPFCFFTNKGGQDV